MNESKIELTERLRREGRWAEASKFKDEALADFRVRFRSVAINAPCYFREKLL